MSGDYQRTGLIIDVPHNDGTPPYVVEGLATGYIAMVMPGQFARIIAAGQAAVAPAGPFSAGTGTLVPSHRHGTRLV